MEQFDVTFVESGFMSEARARLREGGLDAALIDVTLPDGNGLDLVREINDGFACGQHALLTHRIAVVPGHTDIWPGLSNHGCHGRFSTPVDAFLPVHLPS